MRRALAAGLLGFVLATCGGDGEPERAPPVDTLTVPAYRRALADVCRRSAGASVAAVVRRLDGLRPPRELARGHQRLLAAYRQALALLSAPLGAGDPHRELARRLARLGRLEPRIREALAAVGAAPCEATSTARP